MTDTAVVILAAGKGTRMKSALPKVLHELGGRPMLGHVMNAAQSLNPAHMLVVVGHGCEAVETAVSRHNSHALCVEQTEQRGTGHAVQQTEGALAGFSGDVVILCGDCPLVQPEQLFALLEAHRNQGNAITFISALADDPTGLGRVLRDDAGNVTGVVEHKDATEDQRTICEVNTGIYAVKAPLLFELLARVTNNNAQGEYYLPDIKKLAVADGLSVGAWQAEEAAPLLGINSRAQLAAAETIFQNRLRTAALAAGVTMIAPDTVFLSADTRLGQDVTVGLNVRFGPGVTIADNVTIDGDSHLAHTTIAEGAHVLPFCHIDGAAIAGGATVGPFARLRTGSEIGENVKIGSFVETKKARLGRGTKTSHLTYLGDADIGEGVNIGGGTILANYHSLRKTKQVTTIEDGASIGANNTLIAPVRIGAAAFTGGGATITKDVPAGALAVARAEQKTIPGYADKVKKPEKE